MPDRLVVMLAFPGGNLIDIAGPLQAFASANSMASGAAGTRTGPAPYQLLTVSATGGAITTDPGVSLQTASLAQLEGRDIDTLIVPGGLPLSGAFGLEPLVAWLAANGARARRLCSVCTGAFLLADAGLLAGRSVTTHWSRCSELQRRHPSLDLQPDRIFVQDGNVWTSGGVTAGIDLALALIEDDLGHQLAIATARQLVVFVKRPGGQSQFSAPLTLQSAASGGFSELHGWMAENLREDLRVEQLAQRASMSPRNFARRYCAVVGQTPAKAVETMRLEAACRALEQTSQPLKVIAQEVGLGSEQNLRRVLQRQFGIGPTEYRERFGARAGVTQEA